MGNAKRAHEITQRFALWWAWRKKRAFARPTKQPALGVHALEELAVGLRVAQLVEQEVDRIHRSHRIEDAAQDVHLLELLRIGKQLFLARAGSRDVHRREGALVGDLAVEDQLRIPRAFELFEDD